MKLYFKNLPDGLIDGLNILAEDLGVQLCDNDFDVSVLVTTTSVAGLTVTIDGDKASIAFGGGKARFFRAFAILVKWIEDGKTSNSITETPIFTTNGSMVDMSRNAVMTVPTVKFFMRKMALMGLNMFMLYTEDTYHVENRPYFGYMRGRYSKEEIRELDQYAIKLGIELIPCVQSLGHLATALRWGATNSYKDTANVLLAGANETYDFIDDLFKTIAECFTSCRLHIGMDETHDLGTGKYLDKFGYCDRQDIYFSHLNKVVEIAKRYGFSPMMWSDMFFRMNGKNIADYHEYDVRVVLPDDIKNYVPDGVQQVFWDYYNADESFYATNIISHKKLGQNTAFAGGVWAWSGHCLHYSRSLRHTIPALDACKKNGVKEVIATVWHNGAEACLIMALAGLAWYADYDYKGRYDEQSVKDCFAMACKQSYDDFMLTELPEYPHKGIHGVSRTLIYNDPLIGLIDKHFVDIDTSTYYKDVTKKLEVASKNKGVFASSFDVILKLSSVLENKADFGIRLKKAYDDGDKTTLANMLKECDVIIEKLYALKDAHRKAWLEQNKPFGWEVHDIRYGGLIMRFDTAKMRLADYLNGKTSNILELEETRLRFDCAGDDDGITEAFIWQQYQKIATPNIL